MSATSVIEPNAQTLLAECVAADAEFERMDALAEQAEKEFARRKLSANAAKFAELESTAKQARLRADAAQHACDEKRAALDAHQAIEQAQKQREDHERALDAKQRKFDTAFETLLRHRAERENLNRIIPSEEIQLDLLMRELAQLKGAR